MSLKRFDKFASEYRQYRRAREGWPGRVDRFSEVAIFLSLACLAIGWRITSQTGVDGNAFTVAGLVIGLAKLGWGAFDVRRFARRNGRINDETT